MRALILLFLTTFAFANVPTTADLIAKHEGYRSYPYIDANHYSIGYGINLRNGLTRAEALLLLIHRLSVYESKLKQFTWYNHLSPVRKSVILDMTYNLGLTGLLSFKGMIWCLKHHYWHAAANHMRNSLWAKQTGIRAIELSYMMYHNTYLEMK